MQELLNFFSKISTQDYIILWSCLIFWVIFLFFWIEKIYRLYLWLIIGLCVFFIINLILNNLNSNQELTGIYEFINNNKESIWIWSILFIPFFTIILPFNNLISFRINSSVLLNYILGFLFGIFFLLFYLSIFLSIVNNRFLFTLDDNLLQVISNAELINSFLNYFSVSKIFIFVNNNDSFINLSIMIFIFYKMTIGWIIDYIFGKIFDLISKSRNKNKKNNTQESYEID